MLTSASVQGGATHAALYMAAFGAGTLLPVASTGLMAASLRRWMGAAQVRLFFGLLVIAWGALTLLHPDFAERFHHGCHGGQAEASTYCK